ncbi:hypothetical protein [Flammeovirga aprica]|uniref:Uncharacterized protein n=1 Tax=Flammeovirga aprica JL-4 TaxID=694437 RepID=A0A7X9RXJ0_9BACT|nr:hypothetical protein [Flammeovirga aprica]NME70551.1 hypothetical protein [Flammeovirga aprica JL-4]
MKLVRIADYSLILASLLYSSYVSCLFFASILPFYLAIPLALFIVILGHHYSFFAIQYFKENRKLSQASIIAIALMLTVFYSEWKGQHVQAKSVTGIPTTEKIDQHIEEVMQTIHQNANKKNWRNVEQYRSASQQLKMLQEEKQRLLETIEEKNSEAEQLASEFRVFSIILFLIAFVASTLNSDSTAESKISIGTTQVLTSYTPQDLQVLQQRKQQVNQKDLQQELQRELQQEAEYSVRKVTAQYQKETGPAGTNVASNLTNSSATDSSTDLETVIALVKSGELQDRREVMRRLKLNVIQANQLFKKHAPKPQQATIGFVTSKTTPKVAPKNA